LDLHATEEDTRFHRSERSFGRSRSYITRRWWAFSQGFREWRRQDNYFRYSHWCHTRTQAWTEKKEGTLLLSSRPELDNHLTLQSTRNSLENLKKADLKSGLTCLRTWMRSGRRIPWLGAQIELQQWVVRGESAVPFETALQDSRVTAEGEIVPISTDHVQESLKAVTETVFPHRALETQRLWMNRKMFKPVELITRQMASSINRLNNALPFFPNATEASKFLEVELIGLLEWSFPVTWRAKFDLDRYIPPFIQRPSWLKRVRPLNAAKSPSKEERSQNHKMVKRVASRNGAPPAKKQKSVSKHYCNEHGPNPTHSTADCWTIKNRAKPQLPIQKKKKSFSNRNLRNQINLLSKQYSKKKILEMYASVIGNRLSWRMKGLRNARES
jgi:hypothetical protein